MEKVIGIRDLRNAGLLGAEYTELDLYDAFMMYLIVNNTSNNDRIVLRNGNYTLDTKSCFCQDIFSGDGVRLTATHVADNSY